MARPRPHRRGGIRRGPGRPGGVRSPPEPGGQSGTEAGPRRWEPGAEHRVLEAPDPRWPRPGGAHCTLCRGAPARRVLLPSGGAHRVGPGWAGPGAIGAGEVGLGRGAMEARPVPDFSKLQELLAPPCPDPKASRAPPLQQAPRTPGCPRPNGRCVKEGAAPSPNLTQWSKGRDLWFLGLSRGHGVSYWCLKKKKFWSPGRVGVIWGSEAMQSP